jgi:methyl-accepting chemotaxis protein
MGETGSRVPGEAGGVDRLRRGVEDFVAYTPDGTGISDEMWARRHRNILFALLAHVPLLLALGLYDGTETVVTGATIPATPTWLVLGELGIVVVIAALASFSRFQRRTRTILTSVGMMTTSTMLVQFSGGYIEAHFHFFVVMAVIAIYEDWVPFLVGLIYVAVGHGVFSMIDPSRVYNHAAAIQYPWTWAVIHALFILALIGALMTNWRSLERSREEAEERLQQVTDRDGRIERVEAAKAEADARRQEVEELNDHLEAKADAYSATMARAADGELTVRLDTDSESEAMTQIAESFNEMLDDTETTVEEIQAFADRVAATTAETTDGVESATEASEAVSQSIDEISTGADEQRAMLEEVSGEINTLSATVEEVASSAQTVAETSEETASLAQTGEATARDAIESAQDAGDAIDSTVENVQTLDEQMTEIGEIVDLIGDIAEQTNMLALNANIEAARAGGQGDANSEGFSVVASEVKSLAEETREAASDIERLIAETQAQTEATVEEVQTADASVREGIDATRDVAAAFEQVATNAAETDSGIREISRATDDQAASTEEAVSMIEEVADISRRNAEEAERVSGAADRQVSSMSQIEAETDSLAEQTERLQALLAEFDVSGGEMGVTAGGSGDVAVGDGGRQE